MEEVRIMCTTVLLYDVVNDVVNADFKRMVNGKSFPLCTRIFSVSPKRLLDTAQRSQHVKKIFQTETQNQKPYCSWRSKPPSYQPTIARENLACIALLDTGPKGPVSSNQG